MSNFSYVIDSTFQPFSMQEMLTPFVAYKDAFEKSEEAYDSLTERADKFKYLSENLPEGSKARKIYEGYASDLSKQAEDLANNGLSMGNRRALSSLKKRYQGEIGRLMQADEAMREEKKLRQSLNAQDSSRLYATDNLNIDDFLDGNNPNLYSISGNELYARGAEAGKAASSRMTQFGDMGSLIGGLYRDIVQRNGYSQAAMQEFRRNVESIPELADTIDDIMNASGASENLTGVSRGRARQNIINGIVSGAIYQEQHNPTRDPNVLDAMQRNQLDMQQKQYDLQKQELGLKLLALQGKANNSSNGGKGNPSYPQPNKLEYIAGGGSVPAQEVESVSEDATPVKVRANGSKYEVYVTDGDDKDGGWTLGMIDAATGKISGLPKDDDNSKNQFGHYFRHGMNRWMPWNWSRTFDPDYDIANIKAMLKDIRERAQAGGGLSYMNYEYFLEPDNVSGSNNRGGFYRKPINIGGGSVFNEDPNLSDIGYGDKGDK